MSSTLASNPGYGMVTTGHSLGGAIATLAAAALRAAHGATDLYTYGSPRVGNAAFVEHVEALPGGNFRLTHDADPVPLLPPSVLGYRHLSPEYWLVGDSMREDFGVRNVTVCHGLLNFECNGGTLWSRISPLEHSYYFQRVSGCDETAAVASTTVAAANSTLNGTFSWLDGELPGGISLGDIEKIIKWDWEWAGDEEAE